MTRALFVPMIVSEGFFADRRDEWDTVLASLIRHMQWVQVHADLGSLL